MLSGWYGLSFIGRGLCAFAPWREITQGSNPGEGDPAKTQRRKALKETNAVRLVWPLIYRSRALRLLRLWREITQGSNPGEGDPAKTQRRKALKETNAVRLVWALIYRSRALRHLGLLG